MSKAADPDGDVPIDLRERQFTLSETAFLARVPGKSIRNWMARGLTAIGEKRQATGRWYFSIEDALRLAVMHDLCVRPGLDFGPTKAAAIADMVVKTGLESTRRSDGHRPNINVLIAWTEHGEILATAADIKEPGRYYPPIRTEDGYAPLRRTVVAIPATALVIDLVLRTEQLARLNRKQEAPEHV